MVAVPPPSAGDDWIAPADGHGGADDAGGAGDGGGPGGGSGMPWRERKPRLRKLRLLAVVAGLGVLALVSMVFGMLMAVASDIPQLENFAQYKHQATNSFLYDDRGRLIGVLEPPTTHAVFDTWKQISPSMVNAVIAVEDKRFWSEPGIDLRGIARAVLSDVAGGSRQGASTITEQFVKNALQEQNDRTVFEKLREAALAFHLTHRWKKTKILTEYLNSVYFGNGAYGVEQAARVYFGKQLGYDPNAPTDGTKGGCGNGTPPNATECASRLDPAQAALLAGMIASPGAFNPIDQSAGAKARRDVVLKDMLSQNYISRSQYEHCVASPLPTAADIEQPEEPTAAPYFTSWLRPQILAALERAGMPSSVAAYRAVYGGLRIKTTLDLSLQQAADQAVEQVLPYGPGQPTASLVAIDNQTGEVRAMVGGPIVNGEEDYAALPVQPRDRGPSPAGVSVQAIHARDRAQRWHRARLGLDVRAAGLHRPRQRRQGALHRPQLRQPVFRRDLPPGRHRRLRQLGVLTGRDPRLGTSRVAHHGGADGDPTPVSNNYAMILGAMKVGVSPLDMAHAYETFATGGLRVYNPVLGDFDQGPIGIHSIDCRADAQACRRSWSTSPRSSGSSPRTSPKRSEPCFKAPCSPGPRRRRQSLA